MRRVLVVGPGGAGKSTLARRLGPLLGAPVVHLDAEYWRPGWAEPDADAWRDRVAALVARDAWVMDGNFGGTLAARVRRADTVVFLDVHPLRCLARVVRRRWTYRGRPRPDMAEGCAEKLDLEFVRWVLTYRWRARPRVRRLLAEAGPALRVVVLRTPREVAAWLGRVEARRA